MIPFSPPSISEEAIQEVVDTLKSGWITTGPKTKLFEKKLEAFCRNPKTLALSSATAALELMLRWYGITEGDEVILPAYTYAATANVVVHCGAKPVFVDVNKADFNINVTEIKKNITQRTKVIIPVDFAGLPADYFEINELVNLPEIKKRFVPKSENQKKLSRILVLADSAHSIGAKYMGKMTGNLTDVAAFSFHAVKNLTTAEGGAVALNLPEPFDNNEVYAFLNTFSLHGQSKDALAKTKVGNWQYDILEAGYKANMTDIAASIGLAELKRYASDILPKRRYIFEKYAAFFSDFQDIFEIPVFETANKISSFHLFPLRIKNIDRQTRDKIIQSVFEREVSVNVHFLPVPGFTFYKSLGYQAEDYPISLSNSNSEISLPVFYDLTDAQTEKVCNVVLEACKLHV